MNNLMKCLSTGPLFFLLLLSANTSSASEGIGRAIGHAYDKKTGELSYTEEHIKSSKIQHNVIYTEPTGDVFATKYIDYSDSTMAPNFNQVNERNGEEVAVQRKNQTLEVSYRKNSSASLETKVIDIQGKTLVADAGFDQIVREEWDKLENGILLEVDFLVPSRLTTVPFTMAKVECVQDIGINIDKVLCLSIETKAWWLRLLVDPIFMAYDLNNRQLLRFIGRANIGEENGDYKDVDIHYSYHPKI